ncbi:MAG: NAD-dependent epimerase/dehydratase family protein [Anaerolineae bacterium]|nr:NAD-dependent epimerase/dehydratase family protein [Anaerolineae bacterium]
MRVLVIGGTGFTGPYVVRGLYELGHELLLFHRGERKAELPDGIEHVHSDRWEMAGFADELMRFAPQVVLDMIPRNEQDAWTVLSTFKGIAQRVVALSSQDVYRAYGRLIGIEPGPLEPVPLSEDAPLRARLYPYWTRSTQPHTPPNHYEKILAERLYMSEPSLPGTILRFPMVYGPGDRQHRLFEYLKRIADGRPAILLDEGMANWRWTKGYVENLATAVVLAVTKERAAGRIYNVGEQETLIWADWVRAIGRAAGWDGEVVVMPKQHLPEQLASDENTAQHLVADTTRIRKEMGYREHIPREEALRRTVAWERAHPPEKVDADRFDYAAEDAILAKWKDQASLL